MKNLPSSNLMRIFWGISTAAVLVGTLFKIQHYPYGIGILIFGLVSGFVLYNVEIIRLKIIIKNLEEENDKLKAINK
jgi:hypothetical protein